MGRFGDKSSDVGLEDLEGSAFDKVLQKPDVRDNGNDKGAGANEKQK